MQRIAKLAVAAIFADMKESLDFGLWMGRIARGLLIRLVLGPMLLGRALAVLSMAAAMAAPAASTMTAAVSSALAAASATAMACAVSPASAATSTAALAMGAVARTLARTLARTATRTVALAAWRIAGMTLALRVGLAVHRSPVKRPEPACMT